LHIDQRNVLRTITGAATSTPIAAREAKTNIEPLRFRQEKTLMYFWTRQERIYTDKWCKYKQVAVRLKTQVTLLTAYLALKEKHTIPLGEPEALISPSTFLYRLPTTFLLPTTTYRSIHLKESL
jgi:hypothetical protein